MNTLLDLLSEIERLDGREALRYADGYRTRVLTYRQLYARIGGIAALLDGRGFQKGDRLLLWGENRPEWVAAFWACLARGVSVVPVDYRSSPALARRIQQEVAARLLVHGRTVDPAGLDLDRIPFDRVSDLESPGPFKIAEASPDDIVEIVYTSGATGDPKGVVHRHRNICANLRAFGAGIDRYRPYLRPFQPLRILDLLPLSHMFGQSLGLYIPLLLGGAALFMADLHPGAVVQTVRNERASALVAVPRMLESLRREVERRFESAREAPGSGGLLKRAWRHRRIHAAFGWKFWFLVVGGARVDPDLEAFWNRLGFPVVQGYGLTEASPVVAVNHPFRARQGSLGKALKGQEVKIAPDGEILVRGDSIVSEYYGGGKTEKIAEDGWLHTGDIGDIDAEGRLYYRGRKGEIIVTADGLNVYPQDIEAVLDRLPEIRESAVVGKRSNGGEAVHAVLILADPNADPGALIRSANRELEPHQRIRGWSLWPEERLPRTPSTLKLRRREIADRLAGAATPAAASEPAGLEGVLARLTGRPSGGFTPGQSLAHDLGLSSLEMIDLAAELEAGYGVALDEGALARLSTVGELKAWLEGAQEGASPAAPSAALPPQAQPAPPARLGRWPQALPVRWFRALTLEGLILPALRLYTHLAVEGREHLRSVEPPLLVAANHTSHLDTPAVFAALPARLRRRLAPAMRQDYFQPREASPAARAFKALQYALTRAILNAFPLPREAGGARVALRYMGDLTDRGCCPLVFPEGRRTPDGALQPFRPGIGLMALRLHLPVLPVHIQGLFQVLPIHKKWPRPGRVRIRIGRPLRLEGQDYAAAARQVEAAIRALADRPPSA